MEYWQIALRNDGLIDHALQPSVEPARQQSHQSVGGQVSGALHSSLPQVASHVALRYTTLISQDEHLVICMLEIHFPLLWIVFSQPFFHKIWGCYFFLNH